MPSERTDLTKLTAGEIAQEKLPEIITAARAFGADKALELFAAALESYAREERERWIDNNSTKCDACQHEFVDLTAITEGGIPHSTAGDPEGEGSGCAFCMHADAGAKG